MGSKVNNEVRPQVNDVLLFMKGKKQYPCGAKPGSVDCISHLLTAKNPSTLIQIMKADGDLKKCEEACIKCNTFAAGLMQLEKILYADLVANFELSAEGIAR